MPGLLETPDGMFGTSKVRSGHTSLAGHCVRCVTSAPVLFLEKFGILLGHIEYVMHCNQPFLPTFRNVSTLALS